jgi:hypothetical protein
MIELSQEQLEKRLAKMPMPEISEEELLNAVAFEMASYGKQAALVALGYESVKELKKIAKRVKENMIFRKRFNEFHQTAAPTWDKKRNAFICMGLDK